MSEEYKLKRWFHHRYPDDVVSIRRVLTGSRKGLLWLYIPVAIYRKNQARFKPRCDVWYDEERRVVALQFTENGDYKLTVSKESSSRVMRIGGCCLT